ncbi:MAG: hypothetical protein COV44_08260 [Deltaproteobacteria bacterium CG11_big_fil_rev_8_21_14_0_20_45_16]|nr:MAG: hypothetical protein COV44_08260 [Deltaproteobacteria bacterium CG11_big_fil_rev_8_21_14_0_20_45_16]
MKSLGMGERIRKLREARGLSVEALAKVIGVSESELIRIEANKDFPKIAVLIGLAKFMKINVADIFRDAAVGKSYEIVRKTERLRLSPLLSPLEAKRLDYSYEPLTLSGSNKHLDAYLIEIPPFQGPKPDENLTHAGEEFIYILEGKVIGELEGERHELSEGDSLFLKSMISHSFYNPFEQKARAISVIYPY